MLRINRYNASVWMGAVVFLILLFLGIVDPFAIVMAYFFETIAIGITHACKMYGVSRYNRSGNSAGKGGSSFKILFFLFHYSFFVAVQSIFVFAAFSISDPHIEEPFYLIANFSYALSMDGFVVSMGIMFLIALVHTFFTFIKNKEYTQHTVDTLFFQPYLRIFIQQFTVILAVIFALLIPDGLGVALLLILLRLFVDLLGTYISSDPKNRVRLARLMAKNPQVTEEEALEELKKFF